MRSFRPLRALLLALLLSALVLPRSALGAQTSPHPSALVKPGTRVRVWTDAVWQWRIASQAPEAYEGTLVRWRGDTLVLDLVEPVVTVAGTGIGKQRTENDVPLRFVTQLVQERRQFSRQRLKIGALLGAGLGAAAMLLVNGECEPGRRCGTADRIGVGAIVFGLTAGLYGLRPVTWWEMVPLPEQPAPIPAPR